MSFKRQKLNILIPSIYKYSYFLGVLKELTPSVQKIKKYQNYPKIFYVMILIYTVIYDKILCDDKKT